MRCNRCPEGDSEHVAPQPQEPGEFPRMFGEASAAAPPDVPVQEPPHVPSSATGIFSRPAPPEGDAQASAQVEGEYTRLFTAHSSKPQGAAPPETSGEGPLPEAVVVSQSRKSRQAANASSVVPLLVILAALAVAVLALIAFFAFRHSGRP